VSPPAPDTRTEVDTYTAHIYRETIQDARIATARPDQRNQFCHLFVDCCFAICEALNSIRPFSIRRHPLPHIELLYSLLASYSLHRCVPGTMPKVVTHAVVSSSEQAGLTASARAVLRSYYCLCGDFVLVIQGKLDRLPQRK
jgi:hypothetical protein